MTTWWLSTCLFLTPAWEFGAANGQALGDCVQREGQTGTQAPFSHHPTLLLRTGNTACHPVWGLPCSKLHDSIFAYSLLCVMETTYPLSGSFLRRCSKLILAFVFHMLSPNCHLFRRDNMGYDLEPEHLPVSLGQSPHPSSTP